MNTPHVRMNVSQKAFRNCSLSIRYSFQTLECLPRSSYFHPMSDEEIWKPLVGLRGYEISNLGRARSLGGRRQFGNRSRIHKPTIRKMRIDKDGYFRFNAWDADDSKTKTVRLHVAVATAFIPNPNGLKIVNHIDGNKQNCRSDNLEWTTPAGNTRHAVGVLHKGRIKLTREQVCNVKNSFGTNREIADATGVPIDEVRRIKNGDRWNCFIQQ